MQPEVLFPPVTGAVVVIAVIAAAAVLRRGQRAPEEEPVGGPTAAGWTGEAATGDPASATGPGPPSSARTA